MQQFLDEHLLAQMARDEGFAPDSADRVSAARSALREQARTVEPVERRGRARSTSRPTPRSCAVRSGWSSASSCCPTARTADEAWRAIQARGDFDAVAREMSDRPGVVYGGYTEDVVARRTCRPLSATSCSRSIPAR